MQTKRYTVKLMFGDADSYRTQTYTSSNPDEILFLDTFLHEWNELDDDWFQFYDDQDCEATPEFIDSLNRVIHAVTPYLKHHRDGYQLQAITIDSEYQDIQTTVCDIFNFAMDITDWSFDDSSYTGELLWCSIDDFSGKIAMTLQEMIDYIKKQTGKDVYLKDAYLLNENESEYQEEDDDWDDDDDNDDDNDE